MNNEKMSAQGGSALGGKTKKLAYWASVTTLGIILGVSLQFVRAWTEPTAPAPAGNVGAPINTSNLPQTKDGTLVLKDKLIIGTGTNDNLRPNIIDVNDAWIRSANGGAGKWASDIASGTSSGYLPALGATAVRSEDLWAEICSEGCTWSNTKVSGEARYVQIAGVNKFQVRATVNVDGNKCDTGWVDAAAASCTVPGSSGLSWSIPDTTSHVVRYPLGIWHNASGVNIFNNTIYGTMEKTVIWNK